MEPVSIHCKAPLASLALMSMVAALERQEHSEWARYFQGVKKKEERFGALLRCARKG